MKVASPVLFLELNEINFDFVRKYCEAGMLPNLAQLLRSFPLHRTSSEKNYEELEPWIQWVTAHTGKPLSEHGVFRLGDIINTDIDQIWEQLERRGVRVGAVSPMNAKNRLREPAFFIPDPWTRTKVSAGPVACGLHDAICAAVNENASGRFGLSVVRRLVRGLLAYARPSNYWRYVRYVLGSLRGAPWRRALFLDLLLADVFVRAVQRTSPQFRDAVSQRRRAHPASLHVLLERLRRAGDRNPGWYIKPAVDPVRRRASALRPHHRFRTASNSRCRVHDRHRASPGSATRPATYYWRLKPARVSSCAGLG